MLQQRMRQSDGRGTTLALAATGVGAAAARDPDTPMASEPTLDTLAALVADAESSAAFASAAALGEEADSGAGTGAAQTREQARRHYVRALHKVLEEANIILLVLNVRDPDGCRSRLVKEEVRRREADGKRLVCVLTRSVCTFLLSLLPFPMFSTPWSGLTFPQTSSRKTWLRHLRHSTPTLRFRSASNGQRSNLSSATAPALMRLLKAFKPSARSATVGVVGYPNVGKSGLINALKCSKVPFSLLLWYRFEKWH
jgi:nuclear GTP-binding protein